MKFSSIVKVLLGILIAGAGLYIFFKDVDIDKLLSELASMRIPELLGACFFVLLTLYFRALRMKYLLPASVPGTNRKYLFSNVAIGYMLNNLLPARLGEASRALLLWQKNRYSVAISIGILLIERIIDTIAFLTLFIIPALLLPQCASLHFYTFCSIGIIAGIVLFTFIYIQFNSFAVRIVKWIIHYLPGKFQPGVIKILKEVASTLGWLYSPVQFLKVICFSVLTVTCYPAMIILLGMSLGVTVGLLEGMFAQAFAAFGAAIPLAPGYVGTLHAVMLQGFAILGINEEKARAIVVVYHGINYILIIIVGLIFFFRLNLSFNDMFNAQKRMNAE